MSEHHECSPSKFPAWAECPGYASDGKSNEASTAGTIAHDELSKSLIGVIDEPNSYPARWAKREIESLSDGATLYSELNVIGTIDGLKGISGTTDIHWTDADGVKHYGDFKTFSDGTKDYSLQLKGYAALDATPSDDQSQKIVLHVFHGGICKTETIETTLKECVDDVLAVLNRKTTSLDRNLCSYCQYCSKAKECPKVNNAIEVVGNNSVSFQNMSICQKLVVLDAVEKLAKTIREEAKAMAEASEDKAIEMDGIRYELKQCAGKPKLTDICQLAGSIRKPVVYTTNRKGESSEVEINGITNEELLAMCDLPKSKVADALKEKNADNKAVKKSDIEKWVGSFYEKTEGTPRFTRVK